MPSAARNILSDPDLEQFMRDAIYMLHRELSRIRKDVDMFKEQGDPALVAAMGERLVCCACVYLIEMIWKTDGP
jgi:hypothetical protein